MKRSRLVLLMGGALSLATACGDDTSPSVDDDGSTSGGGNDESSDGSPSTTQTTTLTTSADSSGSESSTDPTDADSSGSESSDGGSSESGDETSTGDLCGNDVVDDGEVCDGTDLADQDCVTQDFDGGTLGCNASCSGFDTSLCTLADCGDGVIGGRETCDGADLGGATCVSEGYDAGTLACAPSCANFNFTGCSECGDNNQNGVEVCDGNDFNGATCETEGFAGGSLTCADDCSGFDTTACDSCGNGVIDADGEICDSPDFAGENCTDYGFTAGTLACTDGCTTIDPSGCFDGAFCVEEEIGSAVGNGVAYGSNIGADDDVVEGCGSGTTTDHMLRWIAPAAGTYRFDTVDSSFDTVLSLHDDCASASWFCNDDVGFLSYRDSRIVTDVVAGQIVILSVTGYSGGTGDWVLNINLDGEGGECCVEHGIAGCDSDDGSCETAVCAIDANCCGVDATWTAECVALAVANCESCQNVCGNNLTENEESCDGTDFAETCGTLGFDYGDAECADDCTIDASDCGNFEGDCCSDNGAGSPGCEDDSCNALICADMPQCCDQDGTWDAACAAAAATGCATCNPDVCGNNLVDVDGEVCDGIDLQGEDCVTQGFVFGDLGCADDCTGYDTSTCFAAGAECCASQAIAGCTDTTCNDAVCAEDSFCCVTAWDTSCANTAVGLCSVCGGGIGDCCTDTGEVGCNDNDCAQLICGFGGADPTCCTDEWTAACTDLANDECPVCGA